jgi:nucleoside-diphosphate-sugar epimerase
MPKSSKRLFGLPEADLAEILAQAREDLELWRGARLFVTGGTGFFGKWLLGALAFAEAELGLGLRVTVLSRDPAAFLARHPEADDVPSLRFVHGPVADFSFDGERHDFILHAATDTTAFTTAAEEEERARAIVDGTRRMLALAREGGARRFLYVSSGAVYGAAAGRLEGACEEDAVEAAAVTPYGRAKRVAEQACADSGVDFVTARAFAFLGPYLPLEGHFAAGNFLRDARRGGPIEVRGDGTAMRSYLYPTDLVVWLLRLLARGGRGRAYNVGSDESVTTAELARRISAACAPAPEVTVQSRQPQGPQNIYLPDIARARQELGLDVRVNLAEAIRRTLAWLEQSGEKR